MEVLSAEEAINADQVKTTPKACVEDLGDATMAPVRAVLFFGAAIEDPKIKGTGDDASVVGQVLG